MRPHSADSGSVRAGRPLLEAALTSPVTSRICCDRHSPRRDSRHILRGRSLTRWHHHHHHHRPHQFGLSAVQNLDSPSSPPQPLIPGGLRRPKTGYPSSGSNSTAWKSPGVQTQRGFLSSSQHARRREAKYAKSYRVAFGNYRSISQPRRDPLKNHQNGRCSGKSSSSRVNLTSVRAGFGASSRAAAAARGWGL